MHLLGISAYYHDAAACLVRDGEIIVGTPEEAFRCFMGTELDFLAVGNCFLKKEDQNPALKQNYEQAFDLD